MTATDTLIEQRASAAPRVTPADIEAAIVSEWYINAADACRRMNSTRRCRQTTRCGC